MRDIFYYHPLSLSFTSAQTLQVIKDYYYLSKEGGFRVYLYGFWSDRDEFEQVQDFIKDSNITLLAKKNSGMNRFLTKIYFLIKLISSKSKFIITRAHQKSFEVLRLKSLLGDCKVIQELHEEAFGYLVGKKISKDKLFDLFLNLDMLIFTNYSQLELYEIEFGCRPDAYAVLPNGVELERFSKAHMEQNFVLTYLGQFNDWKNVPLLFEALALLDSRFTLRIAGGKNDEKSKRYIKELCDKYRIGERVSYLGFVANEKVVESVLDKSHILLLPLGDNIQSKYLTSPMKLFEYMATKIPVLAVDYPSVSSIATEDEIFLAKNSAKEFADRIVEITKCEYLNKKIAKMNEKAKEFSYENRSKKYYDILNN